MPTMRDPSLLVYFRPESGGLIMGGYERHCAPWSLDGIPADFNGKLLEEDWPRFEELMQNAIVRVPSLEEMGVVRLINGPEAFTPDGEFILGPSDVRGFWVAAGFCAHGLAGAGGMGKLVAEWIVEGTPSLDVWHMDSRRFGAAYRSREYTLARTKEIYETYYDVKYPGHEREAGRPLRVSAAYARLRELGAAFGEKSGWERANWFEPNAAAGDESLRPRGWAGKLWSPAIGAEHRACRETAALFDESSFAKIEVVGAGRRRLPREPLRQPRRPRDGPRDVHADAQPARRDRVRLHGDASRRRAVPHRHRHGVRPARRGVDPPARAGRRLGAGRRRDVGVRLPRALGAGEPRDPPAAHGQPTSSNEAFPYMTARELAVGPVPCLAVRVTYVGELGWELYCPTEFGARLWDELWAAGREHGLVAGGYKAIDSLRLEKGYRVWGADISPEDTPYEAGLGFAVKLDKGDFVGRDALVSAAEPDRRLRCLTLADPRAVALGSEPVRVGDDPVGRVTSGGYGYTVGASIAYAYLPAEHDVGTEVAVEIFGEWVGGRRGRRAALRPGRRERSAHERGARRGRRARLAGRPLDVGGARRRDHEPQRQGHAPRRRVRAARRREGHRAARHRPDGRAGGDPRRGRGRRRAGGRRLRRARGMARHALRRRIDPAARAAARARAAPSRRAGAPCLPPRAADPRDGSTRSRSSRRTGTPPSSAVRRSRRVRRGARGGAADRRAARRPAAACRATTTCSTRTSSTTASGS